MLNVSIKEKAKLASHKIKDLQRIQEPERTQRAFVYNYNPNHLKRNLRYLQPSLKTTTDVRAPGGKKSIAIS